MNETNKSYRIRTEVNPKDRQDKYINVQLNNDIGILEILSLKLDTTNFYKLHTSDYGCIAGRVLANSGVGIPNAKVSIFVGLDNKDSYNSIIKELYPYTNTYTKQYNGMRYNLLPEEQVSEYHTPVGTFPSKRMVLDDNNQLEIFDKYYKFTTRTNDSGDYMIFGVPVGDNNIHVDIDISDIGFLSQRPRDMIYKGYNITQFENANKFKSDTKLDSLTQIITQNDSIYVYPFWGETDENQIKITRNDIDIQYKFEPTCIFLGSLITDQKSNGISKKCIPTKRMGQMDTLTTGEGTIEMIRKTNNGGIESFEVQGNQLIDGNGTWCYQIPMNLDYMMTDEYGNLVPSDDSDKGIPTRASVRFRVSISDYESDYTNNHMSKMLIPNNPKNEDEVDYHFGSQTKDSSFRDLFWNNVYTVKSYIPRIQKGNGQRNNRFTGIKQINVNGGNNPTPYNNMRVNLTFMFVLQCALLKMVIKIVKVINAIKRFQKRIFGKKYKYDIRCLVLGDGVCPDLENWYFSPGCANNMLDDAIKAIKDEVDPNSAEDENREDESYCITKSSAYLMQCVEINLAMEHNVIQFDFYNDWINGLVYIPRWFVNIRKKRSYLLGLIKVKAKVQSCMEDSFFQTRRYTQQCAISYKKNTETNTYTDISTPNGCKNNSKQKCHKGSGRKSVRVFGSNGGVVHSELTMQNQKAYYFKPCEWIGKSKMRDGTRCILFATDIVLLGSLDKCNKNGIPQAFEELTSSTYQMPSNLAATNMDTEGFMYGYNTNGAKCIGGKRVESLEVMDNTFDNYRKWSKNTDYYESNPDDDTEYAVTEASGIDWGYTGPNQGKKNFSNFYQPGGHFLGIACTNAEVNIKSCVNLSRICEIGSEMSQRHTVVTRDNDNLKYGYLIPTGLISKTDISDINFRTTFATLNYNNLKTKISKETGYPEYDFIPVHPINFDGSLKEKIRGKDEYNSSKSFDDNAEHRGNVNPNAYRRTLESASVDYYKFRLGLHELTDKEIKSKYLINKNSTVSLPMYENSYYFYFGLKDGNTAIDRFFNEFYASFNTTDEDQSYVSVETDDGYLCEDDENTVVGGTATVDIMDVDSPYFISLEKDGEIQMIKTDDGHSIQIDNNNSNAHTTAIININNFKITGLPSGDYRLVLNAEGYSSIEYSFKINVKYPEYITNMTLTVRDYSSSFQSSEDNKNAANMNQGAVTVGNITDRINLYGLVLYNNTKYIVYLINKDSDLNEGAIENIWLSHISSQEMTKIKGATISDNEDSIILPLWVGNDDYKISFIFSCNGGCEVYDTDTIHVNMTTAIDFYIGDNDITYSKYIKGNTLSWFTSLFSKDMMNNSTKVDYWELKEALLYRYSRFSVETNVDLNVVPFGGVAPYTEFIQNYGEAVAEEEVGSALIARWLFDNNIDEGDTLSYTKTSDNEVDTNDTQGYSLDIHSFNVPSHFIDYSKAPAEIIQKFSNDVHNENSLTNQGRYFVKNALYSVYNGTVLYGKLKKNAYLYQVTDSNGSSTNQVRIPSIYFPSFFNAVMIIDSNTPSSSNPTMMVKYKLCLANFVPFANKNSDKDITLTINSHDYSNKPHTINQLTDNFKKFYATRGYDITPESKEMPSGLGDGSYSFSVSVEDGEPLNYVGDLVPFSTEDSISCIMPSKSRPIFNYSYGLRFYKASAIVDLNQYCTLKSDQSKIGLDFLRIGNNNGDNYNFRGGFEAGRDDITQKVKDMDDPSWDNFQNMVNSYGGIVAIYNKFTNTLDDGENMSQGQMWKHNTPETNTLTIMRIYRKTN